MKYPPCVNETCVHNDKRLCKTKDENPDEDSICKKGKADALELAA